MNWTKTDVKKALGFAQDSQLVAFFDTSSSAVSQWGDKPIPLPRPWEAKAKRPDIFKAKTSSP